MIIDPNNKYIISAPIKEEGIIKIKGAVLKNLVIP